MCGPPGLIASLTHSATALTVAAGSQTAASTASNAAAGVAAAPDQDRSLFDGVTIDRPLGVVPTLLTNLAERMTGVHDPRVGRSLTQVLLAGERLITASLRSLSQGSGAIATGSSVLGKILPMFSIATGAMLVWKGWNELESHDDGVISIIHSKTARTGLLQALAGALLFVPGVGPVLGGAISRLTAAANEMDYFGGLDWPSKPTEQSGERRTTTLTSDVHDNDGLIDQAVDWFRNAFL